MYHLLFYFFTKLSERNPLDADSHGTAVGFTFIIFALHLLAGAGVLDYYNYINIPVFSDVYLYNKLIWMLPALLLLWLVEIVYRGERSQRIIDNFEEKGGLSVLKVLWVLTLIALPIIILIYFPSNAD
jgi:hypothetical protein